MSKEKITFKVKKSGGILGYWLAVGDEDVQMNNDEGSILLTKNRRHILVWWMVGSSGDSLNIVGTNSANKVVVEVKKTEIPEGEIEGNGGRRFYVE